MDDEHYEALVNRQTRNDKIYDTFRKYVSFSLGFTVVVQQEDGGLLTYIIVVEKGNHNHSNRSCMLQIMKTGEYSTETVNIKATPITAK